MKNKGARVAEGSAAPHVRALRQTLSSRMAYLDGLRGVAITLVLLYHAYARWPALVSFGHRFDEAPVLAQGHLGVQLFFLISGYVIFMTLERSSGIRDFMARRWFRLFPAMLAVSVLLFVSAPLFSRPQGIPVLRDLLPGITFIQPGFWETLLASHQGVLEGSFWSLFVEVKFYAVVALIYFWLGGPAAIAGLAFMFIAPLVDAGLPLAGAVNETATLLSAEYWGWFISGALYYLSARARSRLLFISALGFSLIAAFNTQHTKAAAVVALAFALTQCSALARRCLSIRPLAFLGAVSYPLYLLHENILVSMIVSVGGALPRLNGLLVPVLPLAIVVTLAWVTTTWIEPLVKSWVRPAFLHLRGR